MNKPYIDSISTKSDSKYLLIVAAAKRARQITANEPEKTRSGQINPVSQALHEIDEDDLTWEVLEDESSAGLPVGLPTASLGGFGVISEDMLGDVEAEEEDEDIEDEELDDEDLTLDDTPDSLEVEISQDMADE